MTESSDKNEEVFDRIHQTMAMGLNFDPQFRYDATKMSYLMAQMVDRVGVDLGDISLQVWTHAASVAIAIQWLAEGRSPTNPMSN